MNIKTDHVQIACLQVLAAAEPTEKVRLAHACYSAWQSGQLSSGIEWHCRDDIGAPGRPPHPLLAPPRQVQRRRATGAKGRISLLHAIAHIEFNAINLAFDMVARFGNDRDVALTDRANFISDWLSVGNDEARHFTLISNRLVEMGSHYGELLAHEGLWEAATNTRQDVAARLAIAPLVLEARGLDVTPGMINRLKSAGDVESAEILETIYRDEIGHVAAGARWFRHVCKARNRDPVSYFHELVQANYSGKLKEPFNTDARDRAQLSRDFYEPLVS